MGGITLGNTPDEFTAFVKPFDFEFLPRLDAIPMPEFGGEKDLAFTRSRCRRSDLPLDAPRAFDLGHSQVICGLQHRRN